MRQIVPFDKRALFKPSD